MQQTSAQYKWFVYNEDSCGTIWILLSHSADTILSTMVKVCFWFGESNQINTICYHSSHTKHNVKWVLLYSRCRSSTITGPTSVTANSAWMGTHERNTLNYSTTEISFVQTRIQHRIRTDLPVAAEHTFGRWVFVTKTMWTGLEDQTEVWVIWTK